MVSTTDLKPMKRIEQEFKTNQIHSRNNPSLIMVDSLESLTKGLSI